MPIASDMTTDVKICGLKTPDTMAAALEAGANYVGLVFFPPSPRTLDMADAQSLAEIARGRARIVALTVDPDDALVETMQLICGLMSSNCTAARRLSAVPKFRAKQGVPS